MPDVSKLNNYVVVNVDVKDGDIVQFVNAGHFHTFKSKDGDKTKLKIGILCPSGDVKEATINNTSLKALSEGYGRKSEDWVGYEAIVGVVKQNMGGELKNVLYLSPIKGATKKPVPEIKPEDIAWEE